MKALRFNHAIFYPALCMLMFSVSHVDAKIRAARSNGSKPPVVSPGLHNAGVLRIVKMQQAALLAAQNATERNTAYNTERLIATSDYNLSYADTPVSPAGIIDSAHFVYSGQRGSAFNPYLVYFLNPSGSYFSAGAVFYEYLPGSIGQFTTKINVSDVLADRAFYWNSNNQDSAGHFFMQLGEQIFETYDVNSNVTFCSDQVNPIDSTGQWDRIINSYDTDGLIISSLDLQLSGTLWDSNT
jgi:hypothetical protein